MITNVQPDNSRKLFAAFLVLGMSAMCAVLTWRLSTRLDQKLVAGILIFVGVQLAFVAPRVAIVAAFIFVPLSGDVRRLLAFYVGRAQQDPILLVAPVVLCALVFMLFFRGQLDFRTKLSRMVFWLSILMFLQAFNPLQGGLMTGAVGLMLFLIPLSWYWVGQNYGTVEFLEKVLLRVVIPIATVGAIYSLFQITFGLADFQAEWLKESGMDRLHVTKEIPRPLAFFGSAQEAGTFYACAAVIVVAAALSGRNRKLLFLLPLFLWVVLIQGSRGTVVVVLFTSCVMWAINGRAAGSWIVRMAISLALGLAGLIYVVVASSQSAIAVAPVLQHHAKGLTKPTESTAVDHVKLLAWGMYQGTISSPIGFGIGATTLASENEEVGNMEVDFSNIFISLGVVGGILYLVILFRNFQRAIRLWIVAPSFHALATVGLCIAMFPHYLSGMAYSIVILAWFVIGSLDLRARQLMDDRAALVI